MEGDYAMNGIQQLFVFCQFCFVNFLKIHDGYEDEYWKYLQNRGCEM